jgi:hypothetical protein
MKCVFFKLLNLIIKTYLISYQIEHPIKLNTLVKMANGFYSNGTFSQVGQIRMTCLLKMTNLFFSQIENPMLVNKTS